MCRLSAITTKKIDPVMKRLFWNQLMLASNADNQKHGAGMTDGSLLAKSVSPYMDYGQQWLPRMDPSCIWLGHVRAASPGTDINSITAHPFRFTLPNGANIFAAHNGGITGMKIEKGDPNVDSYAAFLLLVEQLKDGGELTPEVINTWTAKFGKRSEWTFMFHYLDKLTIVRGVRDMYYMRLNDGFMFNTSFTVLVHVKEWIHSFWGNDFSLGKIEEIKPYQMTTVDYGSTEIKTQDIAKPTPEENPYETYFLQTLNDVVGNLLKR